MLEAYGRYLDLHEFYKYINSKFGEPIEYTAYLDIFTLPEKVPRKLKITRQYREYISELLEYLISFFECIEPLKDLERIFAMVNSEFEEQWGNGNVQGWEKEGQENGNIPSQVIDLDYYTTAEELVEVGPEKLKEVLEHLMIQAN